MNARTMLAGGGAGAVTVVAGGYWVVGQMHYVINHATSIGGIVAVGAATLYFGGSRWLKARRSETVTPPTDAQIAQAMPPALALERSRQLSERNRLDERMADMRRTHFHE